MAIYDKNELISNFTGDEDILKDLIHEFINKSSSLINDVELAITNKNSDHLKLHAHTLKGVISNFYAEEIRLLAYDLEVAGTNKDFTNVDVKLTKIKSLLPELIKELQDLQNTL